MHIASIVTSLVLVTSASADPLVRYIQPCLDCIDTETLNHNSQSDTTQNAVDLNRGAENPSLDLQSDTTQAAADPNHAAEIPTIKFQADTAPAPVDLNQGAEIPSIDSQADTAPAAVDINRNAEVPKLDSDRITKASKPEAHVGTQLPNVESHRGTGIFDTDYQKRALDAHNMHRANHSANPLTWSANLAQIAQEHASSCFFGHTRSGQNLAKGYPFHDAAIHNGWYNGEAEHFEHYYGMPNIPSQVFDAVFAKTGHFTQVVWKGTEQVGCASSACDGGVVTVCNYEPAGNVIGLFDKNVDRPRGLAPFYAP